MGRDRDGYHQHHPDPAEGSVRQRPLWRGKLDNAERERGHRGEGVERDGRRGIQQGRKTHWQRLIGSGS